MKRVFFLFGTIIGVLVALGLAAVVGVYFWAVRDLPGFTRIADYRPALTTTVLARDGSVIGSFYRENRFLISLDQMPKMLPKAFLAAEDAEFYEHEGVNPVAIFRAFLSFSFLKPSVIQHVVFQHVPLKSGDGDARPLK